MARKNIGRILSGGVITVCIILFCTLEISGQAFEAQKVTFTISGSVGLGGVAMRGLPGNPVTDESGYYSATVDYGWNGTVTPTKEGYTFEPTSRTYTKVTSSQANQDYQWELITYIISGSVGQESVVMNGLPGNPISDSNGIYKATVDYGFSSTVTPTKEGYNFTPANKIYTRVNRNQTNQNYTASRIKFTISGSTGVGGVTMKGLPGDPITSSTGTYSATVEYGWSGTVTPIKEGYTFDPPDRQYTDLLGPETNQDYTAVPITFTISGTTGESGVVMEGLPDKPITNIDGTYIATVNYGFSGTVTPTKEGYTFKPPNRTYSKVISNQDNQDYTAELITFTISGRTGQEGVVMNGLPGNPVTGSDGTYRAIVEYGWIGTVTPEKEGYTFKPDSRPYPRVTRDQMNQDYTAALITFTISGSTDIGGVVMKGLPGNPISGADGTYRAKVQYGFTGTVTPAKEGYTFEPPSRQYTNLIGAEANQNYTATILKYTISGTVISAKGPIEDAFAFAGIGGPSATTNANGQYELSVDYGWRGTVSITKEGYTFKPPNRTYDSVTRDQMNQGYTAEVVMLTISGAVIIGGVPIEGVSITASNGGGSDVTNAKGEYTIKVPYGWSGEVTPTKEGFIFNPPSKSYTNVTQNLKEGVPELPKPPERIVPEPKVPTEPVEAEPRVPPLEREKTPLEKEIEELQAKLEELRQQVPGEPAALIPPEEELVTKVPGEPLIPRVPKEFKGPHITAIFVDTDLREALQKIASQAGVDIYADDTVKPTKVTCRLTGVPLEQALQIILKETGYAVMEIPDSYLVYRPISNIFVDSDLRGALQDIATAADVVIIPDDTVAGVVTCELKEVPLETALEIVLAGTGYAVKKTPYYYLISSVDPESPVFPAASETRRIKMNYIEAPVAVGLLSTAFRPYVRAEPGTHTVSITAPLALTNRIISDLKQLDQLPRHVMLDARIVVMERGDLLNLGIEWSWPNIRAGVFGSDFHMGGDAEEQFHGKWPWGVQIGYTPDATFTNSLELALNLLAENSEARITASPQVFAQDGKEAEIKVVTEEYYMMTAPEIYGYYTRSELEKIESGTLLTITPRIGDNNDITLEMSVELSDSIPRGRGSDLPVVTRRTAKNTVRIKDGGTVVVAGLTESRRRLKEKSTPGLSSLPIVGALFDYTDRDESTREIAVFVTAHIVPETGQRVELPKRYPQLEQPSVPYRTPMQPVPEGEDFRSRLLESLSRNR